MAKKDSDGAKPGKKKRSAKAEAGSGASKPKGGKKAKKASSASHSAVDALAKLAEHPIVADLIAIGATAAVTTIAASLNRKSGKTSTHAVRDAGKAAAAAIGQRLMDEVKAVRAATKKS